MNDAESWPVRSLAILEATRLGTRDFGTYARGLLGGNRVVVQPDGRFVPVPREQWRTMAMEDQFDALLYLGPPSKMTYVGSSPRCRDEEFVRERLRRFAIAGPPPEQEALKKACGV